MKKAMFVTGGTIGTGLCIAETFAKATGWTGRTSNHARDAALLVINRQ